jgi:hypothetical protein
VTTPSTPKTIKVKKISIFVLFLIASFTMRAQEKEITQEEVKSGLELGVVTFVNQVKTTLGSDVGDNYGEFKTKLIGTSNLSTITTEGENLLSITYQLIKENAGDNEIKVRGYNSFVRAAYFVIDYESKASIPNKALANGATVLFGGDKTSFKGFDAAIDGREAGGGTCEDPRSCAHWYSFGCHAHNVGVWLCEHANLLQGLYYALGIIGILISAF